MAPQQFLVPVDFSKHADMALEYTITLAHNLQARLFLLHVRDNQNLNPLAYAAGVEAQTRKDLEDLCKRVQDAGLEGNIALVHGVPWQEIVEMARAKQVDAIIMGTLGRTGIRRILLGSVAEKVVRFASCSVLVMRKPEYTPT